MHKDLLIIKNISREGPGILGELIAREGITSHTADLSLGEEPGPLDGYKAVIVLGGPDSANDETDKMIRELAFIRELTEKGLPFLGICLGLQTLVKACGGRVVRNSVSEIGFRETPDEYYRVSLTAEGRKDPLFDGLDSSFNVFHLHGETVIPSEGMTVLATGRSCHNQIVKAGPLAYGIQCHFELNRELFGTWLNEDPDLLKLDRQQLMTHFSSLEKAYTATGLRLFSNFLRLAGFDVKNG
jgi:GMP synthase-like glutamine amidotransferase